MNLEMLLIAMMIAAIVLLLCIGLIWFSIHFDA
jgi:hypothetical protein